MNINIDYAADDSCMIQLWARGTHQKGQFLKECENALSKWDDRNVTLQGKHVKYCHYRTVKADSETRSYGVCESIRIESKPGRGAYPVTVLDEWLPLFTAS